MYALSVPVCAVGASLLAAALLQWRQYRRAERSVQDWPGARVLFSSAGIVANILPPIKYVSVGQTKYMKARHAGRYGAIGWDLSAEVSFLSGAVIVSIADAQAVQEIFLSRSRFPKPVEFYATLQIFGENVVVTEGEAWKRHRKICAPSFSEHNNRLVWDESVRVANEIFEAWGDDPLVETPHVADIMMKMTLLVFAAAAFGRRVSWADSSELPEGTYQITVAARPFQSSPTLTRAAGHTMPFSEAVNIAAHNMTLKVAVPDSLMGMTAHLRYVQRGFNELTTYMHEMIKERKFGEKVARYDLLSGLLDASNDSADSLLRLSQKELIGNVFIFLMAGHETTSNTLAFALALLALYPDEQEALYQDVQAGLARSGDQMRYEDVNVFKYSAAVVQETLRLFPPVMAVPKKAAEATTVSVGGAGQGEARTSVAVPAGTYLVLDVIGIHRNPRYWRDPDTFRPARFLEPDWPRDAYVPFAAGARGCLGRRFAEVESIAFLSLFVARYKIGLTAEYGARPGETIQEQTDRLCDAKAAFSMTPLHLPLVFTRR